MTVAVPVFRNRVSPVFDWCRTLVVLDINDGRVVRRETVSCEAAQPEQLAGRLASHGVDVLVCGGISRQLCGLIEAQRIRVIPWVSGELDEVISAIIGGKLHHPRFALPGCGMQRRRGRDGGGVNSGRTRKGKRWHHAKSSMKHTLGDID
jgi:predicted Fe-Mo cluster-binding NifX family protein